MLCFQLSVSARVSVVDSSLNRIQMTDLADPISRTAALSLRRRVRMFKCLVYVSLTLVNECVMFFIIVTMWISITIHSSVCPPTPRFWTGI